MRLIMMIVSLLLVLAMPAAAGDKWLPVSVRKLAHQYSDLFSKCTYTQYGIDNEKECDAKLDRMREQLEAKGFCIYGKGVVGKRGKRYFYPGIDKAGTNSGWHRHCYERNY